MSNVLILRGEIHDQQYQIFLQVEITNTLLHYMQFLNGLFQKKKQTGGRGLRFRTYFFENPPGIFLFFLLYPWKFQTKQSSTPRNSTKFLLDPLEINSRVKNQDPWPWKFHIIFSVLLHFRSPPIVIDDSHHEKRGWKLYGSPNTNPRRVRKCNSAIFFLVSCTPLEISLRF